MLSIVIAVGHYHKAIVEQAIASCMSQTLKVSVVVVYDHDRRGTGWARNRGLEQVRDPFVTFLDADDFLEPTYAEKMLRAYDGSRYLYCDWFADKYVNAPDCAYLGRTWHVVTTLLPTAWVRHVGGFDETLPGGEDTDLFMKLTRSGLCGKRLPEALMHYTKGGQRGRAFVFGNTEQYGAGEDYERTTELMIDRYGGLPMACCNDSVTTDDFAPGEAQPGDVQANWLQQGPRQMTGRATGRLYARVGNSRLVWVNPADIDAAPQLLSYVVEMPAKPSEDDFRRFAPQAMAKLVGKPPRTQPAALPLPMPSVDRPRGDEAASAGQVLRLYGNH